jgi:hypothetical protein
MAIGTSVRATALAAMALAVAAPARAAVVTQTEDFGSVVGVISEHYFLEPFDTSLGTLTNVAITVTLPGTINLDVKGLRTTFAYTNASAGAEAQVNGPDNIEVQTILSTPLTAGSFAPGDPPVVASATGPVSNTVDAPAGDFGAFEIASPALLTISLAGISYYAATADVGGVLFGASGDVPGSLTLVYTYTPTGAPVPEPSTVLLFASGLAALGFVSLRRLRPARGIGFS